MAITKISFMSPGVRLRTCKLKSKKNTVWGVGPKIQQAYRKAEQSLKKIPDNI